MAPAHHLHPPVDEMFRNRHETGATAVVESPSRAAGGFPTLGGGIGVRTCADTAGRRDAARPHDPGAAPPDNPSAAPPDDRGAGKEAV
jgi:hypothetical protein